MRVMDDAGARAGTVHIELSSQRIPVHILYPWRRNVAIRTPVAMDFLVEQIREIAVLIEQGAEVLT